ncbi:MAG: ATP-binding cassette domain-containing protein [Candidatus Latescibacteria bacterium]|nr:ATP-binding cassette domain-containing protein [bacterium]MBD3423391.1 ATP-binding cassette domain-containing protein [Candidatus Latescibacterota bacterium]
MIEVEDLRKSFGELDAVAGLSFKVEKGEVFGLLGPNGAGKTTTISMISGLLKPDSGSIRVAGMEVGENRRRVSEVLGIIPQEIALYDELTGRENLHFWGSLYGMSGKKLRESTERILDLVGLTERADDPVREYSGGMKRRINLGAGLIHDPDLILLDEPTLGIDPQARNNILGIIKDEVSGGKTVLYTTHYLEEAESLCDRIAIIDSGTIHAKGTLRELTELAGEEDLVAISGGFSASAAEELLENVRIDHIEDSLVRFFVPEKATTGRLLNRFLKAGIHIEKVSISEPSLESVFLRITGYELRD